MKLYYSPGACSLSPHIVLAELGLPCEVEQVDIRSVPHMTETGKLFSDINPKGSVPALVLDNGELLTEGAVIVQYLADLVPAKKLVPVVGSMDRYRLQEWLNYIASEIHKGFGLLFMPGITDDVRHLVMERVTKRMEFLSSHLKNKAYLMGDFTVADAYLFTCLNWCQFLKVSLEPWPALPAYLKRVADRPAVQQVLKAEGLV
ncbi:glutathione transferase GstA [Paludibacterium purpuratum]|uniref:Glutathione S-transferase n=1 Tax=Paludibacterium purpuratum TaxID=1144873 RepID=A0A4R7AXT9_9NEIS|nr:glutathione transferase GstA [Paludibacterium purpuratum]TDR72489.1 glutathione S-transferase [Paludibacterium purpuratum]